MRNCGWRKSTAKTVRSEHERSLDHYGAIMTFFVLKLQLDENKNLEGNVTEKRHILDLDCSLGPVDLCMTLRFCKKKS